MRKKVAAGNWKMNKTPSEGAVFASELAAKIDAPNCEIILCVPFVDVHSVSQAVSGKNIYVGAQNMYFEESGAYTGEISAKMLLDIDVKYVVIGHSERRQYFYETDEIVNKKAKVALSAGLIPIICIGENLTQREQGITVDLIRLQTKIALHSISKEDAQKSIIAYEPVWAIGTGKTATKEQAQEVCFAIRQVLSEIYDQTTADNIRILYGGSVNAGNAAELFSMPDIDGGLVGGASLKSEFLDIINAASLN